jgi:hypothetical protein
MDAESWLEKAARLQRTLVQGALTEDDTELVRDRIKIALWLRHEFDDEFRESNVVRHDFSTAPDD